MHNLFYFSRQREIQNEVQEKEEEEKKREGKEPKGKSGRRRRRRKRGGSKKRKRQEQGTRKARDGERNILRKGKNRTGGKTKNAS